MSEVLENNSFNSTGFRSGFARSQAKNDFLIKHLDGKQSSERFRGRKTPNSVQKYNRDLEVYKRKMVQSSTNQIFNGPVLQTETANVKTSVNLLPVKSTILNRGATTQLLQDSSAVIDLRPKMRGLSSSSEAENKIPEVRQSNQSI